MYSTWQRLNHVCSLATTCAMVLLALVAVASWAALPAVDPGRIEIRDLIVQRGRLRRPYAREEDLASLRFDVHADVQRLLESYNTKQLYLYLVASYAAADEALSTSAVGGGDGGGAGGGEGGGAGGGAAGRAALAPPAALDSHEVVLWDRIVTRSDARDIRAVGQHAKAGGAGGRARTRGKVRVEDARAKYLWREPSRSFSHVPAANFTLYYSLMPYVGIVSTGIAATAPGPVALPAVK